MPGDREARKGRFAEAHSYPGEPVLTFLRGDWQHVQPKQSKMIRWLDFLTQLYTYLEGFDSNHWVRDGQTHDILYVPGNPGLAGGVDTVALVFGRLLATGEVDFQRATSLRGPWESFYIGFAPYYLAQTKRLKRGVFHGRDGYENRMRIRIPHK